MNNTAAVEQGNEGQSNEAPVCVRCDTEVAEEGVHCDACAAERFGDERGAF